jgi:hypothetical protein
MSDDIFTNLPRKAQELGTPLAHYRNRPRLSLLVVALRAAVRLACGLAFVGLGFRAYAARDGEPGALATALALLSLLAGSLCLASAAWALWHGRRGGNVRGVVSCPGGLVCVLPDRCVVAPWDEIDWVWEGGRRFRTRGGAEVTLPESLEGRLVLAELLYRETFQRLTICASAMILGGRTVEFGPIKMTRDEVAVGGRRLAWPDVRGVDVIWGRVRILHARDRGSDLDVPLAEVPNLHALLALVQRLREGGLGSIVIGKAAEEESESE